MGNSSLSLLFCPACHTYRVTAAVPASNLDAALCVLGTASLNYYFCFKYFGLTQKFPSTKLDEVGFSNYGLVVRSFLMVGNTSVLL